MSAAPLTPRQAVILEAIMHAVVTRGTVPTVRELGEAVGIASTNGVADAIRVLARKGYVAQRPASAKYDCQGRWWVPVRDTQGRPVGLAWVATGTEAVQP